MNVFGIPLKIDPMFFLVAFFMARGRMNEPPLLFQWVFVVFISILVHELGHAMACKAFTYSPQITLTWTGGLTSWMQFDNPHPWKRIIISLAGPFAGFFFFALIYALNKVPGILWPQIYGDLRWVNIGWGIVNLFPVLPLDGGHVVESIEEWITGKSDSVVAPAISVLVGGAVAAWGFSAGQQFIGMLFGAFAVLNIISLYQRYAR